MTVSPTRVVRSRTRPLVPVPSRDDILTAALRHAAEGSRVIPLDNGRTPFLQGHQDLATTDPDTVRRLFDDPRTCGVGVLVGDPVLVIDVDGAEGEASLRELEGRLGALPPTRTVRTPGGGRHLWLWSVDPDVCLMTIAPGVEIKAASQHGRPIAVPVPPSFRAPNGVYTFLDDRPPAELPRTWMRELWDRREARDAAREAAPARDSDQPATDFERREAQRILERACERIAGLRTGRRTAINEGALLVGGYLWALDEEGATRRLIEAGRRSLWHGDIVATVRHGLQDGAARPLDVRRSTIAFSRPPAGPPIDDAVPVHPVAAGRDDGEIRARVAIPPASAPERWVRMDTSGNPLPCYANARLAIQCLGVVCEHDTFKDRLRIGGHAIQDWQGELSDNAVARLRQLILDTYGFDPGLNATRDAVQTLCLEHPHDPVCDYLAGLVWDRTPRLDTWLTTYMGGADTPLTRAIGRKTLVAAVRRARQPGCKFDQLVVLESPEGHGKSTAISILAGEEHFTDARLLEISEKERAEITQGVWLGEIAELSGMAKSEVEPLKAYLSRRVDRLRPAYARFAVDWPRRCILFGTTNNDHYLRSQTGNRRFWPVAVGRIDLAGLRQDRDQLWAEAAGYEAGGESITLPEHLWAAAAVEQEARREIDPWEDCLAHVRGVRCTNEQGRAVERVATERLLDDGGLGIPKKDRSQAVYTRLKHVMRHLGWTTGPKKMRIGARVDRGYERGLDQQREPEQCSN